MAPLSAVASSRSSPTADVVVGVRIERGVLMELHGRADQASLHVSLLWWKRTAGPRSCATMSGIGDST